MELSPEEKRNIYEEEPIKKKTEKLNFQEIYNENYPKVLAFIYNVSANAPLSEDLTQETFIRAYKSINDFKGDSNIIVWLKKIGYNIFLDYRRKRTLNLISSGADRIKSLLVARVGNIENDIMRKIMSGCVQSKILLIPENYRAPIYLNMEGYSNKEIATILNLSLENVKIRLHRGKLKIGEILSKECNLYYDERNVLCCEPVSNPNSSI